MLTREQKRAYRSDLFRHLDGIATAPTAYALKEKGVLDYLLERKEVLLSELTKKFESVYRGDTDNISDKVAQDPIKGEYVVVIGKK